MHPLSLFAFLLLEMPSITTRNRQQIYFDGQLLRAAESSRHGISELAFELLQKRVDERCATNERTNFEERARVENEHSSSVTRLEYLHEKKIKEHKDAEFAIISEFDVQRDNLPGTRLRVEGLKQAELLESLQIKLASDDQTAEEELKKAVEVYDEAWAAHCKCCTFNGPDIAATRRQAEQSTLERHNAYDKLVERHTAEWKLRQEALQLELDTRTARQVRLDLEHDFQLRFAECGQSWATIQKRQTEELEALEKNRDLALAAVQKRHEYAEAELYEEHRRIEEWWNHLCDETVAARKRIDQDEQSAVAEPDRDKAGGTVAPAEVTQAAKMVVGAVAYCHERAEEAETLEFVPPNVEKKAAAVCHTPGEEDSDAGLPVIVMPPAPAGDTRNPAGSSLSGASRGPLSQPSVLSANMARLPDESSLMPLVSANFDPHYDPTADGVLRPGAERYTTLANPFAHAEREIVVVSQLAHSEPGGSVPDRSGSPDSGGSDSDFIEI